MNKSARIKNLEAKLAALEEALSKERSYRCAIHDRMVCMENTMKIRTDAIYERLGELKHL